MIVSEIFIGVLLGIIIIVSSIYLTYFLLSAFKKKKERYDEGDFQEEKSIKGRVFTGILISFFALSMFVFITNLTYRFMPLISNQYYVSVNSDSMAKALDVNTYLSDNHLTNQIYQYDVAVCDKYENQELKQYDIILFKKENKRIIHRITKINEDGTYITQGDNNYREDDWTVNNQEILGIYHHSLKFMSFINYLGYTPGLYVLMTGFIYDFGVVLYFDIKKEKLKKSLSNNLNS